MSVASFYGLNCSTADIDPDTWALWGEAEPVLRGVSCLEALMFASAAARDEAIGALARLGAVDGGDDVRAATAVVVLLRGGARRLAAALEPYSGDVEAHVVSALWLQVRTFPWRRRRRAYAANLLLDTRGALMSDFIAGWDSRRPRPVDVFDPFGDLEAVVARSAAWCAEPTEPQEARTELLEVLEWAATSNVLDDADVRVLVELVDAGETSLTFETPRTLRGSCSGSALAQVAQAHAITVRTVKRRRDRALNALRAAVPTYVSEVA